MSDSYVSVTSWQVLEYNSGYLSGSHPEQVFGLDPLDPPDDTYLWPLAQQGTGPIEIGVALFDAIDVTNNPSPRFHIRASGTLAENAYDVGLQIQIISGRAPYEESAQIGPFIYPYPLTWRNTGEAGHYAEGSIQEAEFGIPAAAQTDLAVNGLSVWIGTNGSGTSLPSQLGLKIHEFRIALASINPPQLRKYPNPTGLGVGPARHWPRPRRGITGIR